MSRVLLVLAVVLPACAGPAGAPQATTRLPLVELKYAVFEQIGRPWYCDPDFYPIARADEKDLARERLPEMQADPDFRAILVHNGIAPGAALTDDQLLAVYHDWKDLARLELAPVAGSDAYGFSGLIRPRNDDKQGQRIDLRVSPAGRVTVIHREKTDPPMCPICLAETTLIDTLRGQVRVTELRVGDLVWTVDERARRVTAPLAAAASLAAPIGHEVVLVTLADGRSVAASPGHPLADGRLMGALAVGDPLDGSRVSAVVRLPYRGRTYDVLPAGPTGAYWADGVLLRSTLAR